MTIPNKQTFEHGDKISHSHLNEFQDSFASWIANHHHVHRSIPILTLTNETKIDALLGNDNFLYNFTNKVVNTSVSFSDYSPIYVILDMKQLSELYQRSILLGEENQALKSLIFSYKDSYTLNDNGDTYQYIFKNPTLSEEDLDLIIEVGIANSNDYSNDEFSFNGVFVIQKPQTIRISKAIIEDFSYYKVNSEYVLQLTLNVLENAFVGIPALAVGLEAVRDKNGKTALQHITDLSLHPMSFATEAGLMETAKSSPFATPNYTKEHPLFMESKFLITSNDKMLGLNIIKNELNNNTSTVKRATDAPLDGMFRGNSRSLSWINDNYFSGEERSDAAFLKDMVQEDYNYEISVNESGKVLQTFARTEDVPSRESAASPSTMFNSANAESRAIRMVKEVRMGTAPGKVISRLPAWIRMTPNTHTDSYLYSYHYGIKRSDLNDSLLGNYSGQGIYNSAKTHFQYNISKGLYQEKVLYLGSPYECFNVGAEHLYTSTVQKDFAHPDSNFNGYFIKKRSLSEIKKEESRLL